jgi:hypothetical protein
MLCRLDLPLTLSSEIGSEAQLAHQLGIRLAQSK